MRRQDVGLYLVLGASRSSVALMILVEILAPATLGVAAGLIPAMVAAQLAPYTDASALAAASSGGSAVVLVGALLGGVTVAWSERDRFLSAGL
ncbi:MAG: FtsX-like permease family protein [Acidimicrobiales bacterium]